MQFLKERSVLKEKRRAEKIYRLLSAIEVSLLVSLAIVLSGCSETAVKYPVPASSGPQIYMAPVVAGGTATSATATQATYSFDDTKQTFTQATYSSGGEQVNYSGNTASLQRGLLSLGMTYSYGYSSSAGGYVGTTYTPPQLGSFAVELADQAGGLAQLQGQPFVPLAASTACPAMSAAQTFQFVTLPARLLTTGTGQTDWNPQLETAYGTVDISASGSTITLNNISQFTLAGGAPQNPSTASMTGACSATVYGNTVAIPGQLTVTNPGPSGQTATPQAIMAIGPSGLLVEDNGSYGRAVAPYYQNALGAGTGGIGLPRPASALSASALVGAQYLGFFYGSGNSSSHSNWFSSPASFGFSSVPPACSSVSLSVPLTNPIYGGDFPGNNPGSTAVQNNNGFASCYDVVIDLGGTQSSNGLFSGVNVWVGPTFNGNTTRKTWYSIPAVAIAGQLNGKYAVFLIGEDLTGSPNQAWGIYLLQSN